MLRRADVAVFVVNIAQLAEEEEFSGQLPRLEQDMLTWLEERKVPAIIVLHQADQLPVQEAEQIRHQTQGKYPGHAVVLTSVVKKQGIEELKDQLGSLQLHRKSMNCISSVTWYGPVIWWY